MVEIEQRTSGASFSRRAAASVVAKVDRTSGSAPGSEGGREGDCGRTTIAIAVAL